MSFTHLYCNKNKNAGSNLNIYKDIDTNTITDINTESIADANAIVMLPISQEKIKIV